MTHLVFLVVLVCGTGVVRLDQGLALGSQLHVNLYEELHLLKTVLFHKKSFRPYSYYWYMESLSIVFEILQSLLCLDVSYCTSNGIWGNSASYLAALAFRCTGTSAESGFSIPDGVDDCRLLLVFPDKLEAEDALAVLQVLAVRGHIGLE